MSICHFAIYHTKCMVEGGHECRGKGDCMEETQSFFHKIISIISKVDTRPYLEP